MDFFIVEIVIGLGTSIFIVLLLVDLGVGTIILDFWVLLCMI